MKKLIVVGHKNPDTDSVVSAFAAAFLLKKATKVFPWFSNFDIKAGRSGELNRETKFVFNYFKEKPPVLIKSLKNKDVFLVDHNEYGQAVDGLKESRILGIMDHHSLGGLETSSPVYFCAEPIGSTSTIIAKIFFNNKISLPKKIAGLLLSGILSDTLKFTSPTTTNEDKKIAKELEKIAGENINNLAKKMFEAKSDISGIPVERLISQDYKDFNVGGVKFGFGILETADFSQAQKVRSKILTALEKMKKDKKMDFLFFAFVDILNQNSQIIILSEKEKEVAEKAFGKKEENGLIFLPGVVSRKKQMIPPLKEVLSK